MLKFSLSVKAIKLNSVELILNFVKQIKHPISFEFVVLNTVVTVKNNRGLQIVWKALQCCSTHLDTSSNKNNLGGKLKYIARTLSDQNLHLLLGVNISNNNTIIRLKRFKQSF